MNYTQDVFDKFYNDAVELCKEREYLTISYLQRNLCIGFPLAGQIFVQLIKNGQIESTGTVKGNKVIKK